MPEEDQSYNIRFQSDVQDYVAKSDAVIRKTNEVSEAFERGLATWREYIRWTTERPSFRERSSGGSGASEVLNQPFWLSLLRRAKAQGLTEREALSQRVKTVLWESVAASEEMGAVVWCSEEEMALQAHLLALQKQAKQKPEEQKPIEPKADEQDQTAMKPEEPSHA